MEKTETDLCAGNKCPYGGIGRHAEFKPQFA